MESFAVLENRLDHTHPCSLPPSCARLSSGSPETDCWGAPSPSDLARAVSSLFDSTSQGRADSWNPFRFGQRVDVLMCRLPRSVANIWCCACAQERSYARLPTRGRCDVQSTLAVLFPRGAVRDGGVSPPDCSVGWKGALQAWHPARSWLLTDVRASRDGGRVFCSALHGIFLDDVLLRSLLGVRQDAE